MQIIYFFIFHTLQQIKVKTASAATASAAVRLNIHKLKTNIPKYNSEKTHEITLDGEALEQVKTFTYLGDVIDR